MFPFTKVPFWVPIFDPQPYVNIQNLQNEVSACIVHASISCHFTENIAFGQLTVHEIVDRSCLSQVVHSALIALESLL